MIPRPLVHCLLTAVSLVSVCCRIYAQPDSDKPSETGALPPKAWVDKDTGHRVWRVSDEPNSGAFYFNVNAFTPDHKQMVYNSPGGIRVLDLATMTTKLLVANTPPPADSTAPSGRFGTFMFAPRAIVVGHKTNSVFFTRTDPATRTSAIYKADTNTGEIRKLIELPAHISIASVNADESLGVGTYNETDCPGGDPNAPNAFKPFTPDEGRGAFGVPGGAQQPNANAQTPRLGGANVQSDDKGQMMERRLAARIPVVLFTIRLEPGPNGEKTGTIKPLLHSTDWIGHMLFSPADPQLLMYCH